jgi:FkbM family methyltransferase
MTNDEHRHHEIFSRFRRWSGVVPAGFEVDFLGSKCRTSYFRMMKAQPNDRHEAPEYPPVDEEYFEWIDLLEAAAWAKDRFVMMELGAGFGRWTARGAAAAKQLGLAYSFVAVEAEPTHFQWLEESLCENGVEPENFRLVNAAVTAKDGSIGFHVGDPFNNYGKSIGGPTEVPAVSLTTLLEPFERVDLVDLDVEGAELEILAAARGPLNRKVRRVHVETHSDRLHQKIENLLGKLGWRPLFVFGGDAADQTPWGRINFQGGVQGWINPKLHSLDELKRTQTVRNTLGWRSLKAARRALDRVAPGGTGRRKMIAGIFSGLAARYHRDSADAAQRPTDYLSRPL